MLAHIRVMRVIDVDVEVDEEDCDSRQEIYDKAYSELEGIADELELAEDEFVYDYYVEGDCLCG